METAPHSAIQFILVQIYVYIGRPFNCELNLKWSVEIVNTTKSQTNISKRCFYNWKWPTDSFLEILLPCYGHWLRKFHVMWFRSDGYVYTKAFMCKSYEPFWLNTRYECFTVEFKQRKPSNSLHFIQPFVIKSFSANIFFT